MSKPTKVPTKPKSKIIPAQNDLALKYDAMSLCVLSKAQFEILTEKVPPHALKKREDGYEYVASGWVKKKLFDAFGMDWSEELLPIDGDKMYLFKEDTQNGKTVRYISVMLQLHANVRNPKTLEIVATFEKVGVGSQVWRNKMELGDAIKGAKTDAIRNAAFDLGIGFNYKWDEEAEVNRHAEKQKAQNGFSSQDAPQTLGEFLVRSTGFDPALVSKVCLEVANVADPSDVEERFIAQVWAKLQSP